MKVRFGAGRCCCKAEAKLCPSVACEPPQKDLHVDIDWYNGSAWSVEATGETLIYLPPGGGGGATHIYGLLRWWWAPSIHGATSGFRLHYGCGASAASWPVVYIWRHAGGPSYFDGKGDVTGGNLDIIQSIANSPVAAVCRPFYAEYEGAFGVSAKARITIYE